MYKEEEKAQYEHYVSELTRKTFEQVAALLAPFKHVTMLLHYSTTAYRFVFIEHILKKLKKSETTALKVFVAERKELTAVNITTQWAKNMRDRMIAGLKERFELPTDRDLALMVLDPRMRNWILKLEAPRASKLLPSEGTRQI